MPSPARPYRFVWPHVLRPLLLLLLLAALPAPKVQAQESGEKKILSIAEYRLWRSISGAQISPDGH